MTKFSVFINENSGGVNKLGRDYLAAKLRQALEGYLKELVFLPPEKFQDALDKYTTKGDHYPLIGGGDGTILGAVKCFKKKEQAFGVLPLGTMNCVVRDLGMSVDPIEVARGYRSYKEISIDVATANGQYFLCNAMFGFPTEMAKEREKNRKEESLLTWVSFVGGAVDKLDKTRRNLYQISYDHGEHFVRMKAGLVSNNLYDTKVSIGHPFQKTSLEKGELGIYTIDPQDYVESLQLLSSLSMGAWNEQQGLNLVSTTSAEVSTDQETMDVLLDGEHMTLKTPVTFGIEPKSLRLIVPA